MACFVCKSGKFKRKAMESDGVGSDGVGSDGVWSDGNIFLKKYIDTHSTLCYSMRKGRIGARYNCREVSP